jgi:hypothetical protein
VRGTSANVYSTRRYTGAGSIVAITDLPFGTLADWLKMKNADAPAVKREAALVMTGLLIDAYLLRKYTASFDHMFKRFLAKHPGTSGELKTKVFINGSGGWSKVDPGERKKFLEDVCALAADCSTIFAVAFSFENFEKAANAGHCQPFKSYWVAAAMFIAALVQKQMKKKQKNKGHTVFICDDNQREMSNFSDALYNADPWFDPIYQTSKTKGGKSIWCDVPAHERFDQIINTGFAIIRAFLSGPGSGCGVLRLPPSLRVKER